MTEHTAENDVLPCCRGEGECQAPPDIGPCDPLPSAENGAPLIGSPRDAGTPRLMYQAGRDGDWMKFAETFNTYMDRERAEAAYFAMWHFFLRLPHSPLSDMVQREAMRLREAIPARVTPPAERTDDE